MGVGVSVCMLSSFSFSLEAPARTRRKRKFVGTDEGIGEEREGPEGRNEPGQKVS